MKFDSKVKGYAHEMGILSLWNAGSNLFCLLLVGRRRTMGERDRKVERKNGVSRNSLYELQSICMNISKIHRGKGKVQVHLWKSLNLSSLKDSFFSKAYGDDWITTSLLCDCFEEAANTPIWVLNDITLIHRQQIPINHLSLSRIYNLQRKSGNTFSCPSKSNVNNTPIPQSTNHDPPILTPAA